MQGIKKSIFIFVLSCLLPLSVLPADDDGTFTITIQGPDVETTAPVRQQRRPSRQNQSSAQNYYPQNYPQYQNNEVYQNEVQGNGSALRTYNVKPGDTIWSVAHRYAQANPNINEFQVIASIYRYNPRAFAGGNVNNLVRTTLRIPPDSEIAREDMSVGSALLNAGSMTLPPLPQYQRQLQQVPAGSQQYATQNQQGRVNQQGGEVPSYTATETRIREYQEQKEREANGELIENGVNSNRDMQNGNDRRNNRQQTTPNASQPVANQNTQNTNTAQAQTPEDQTSTATLPDDAKLTKQQVEEVLELIKKNGGNHDSVDAKSTSLMLDETKKQIEKRIKVLEQQLADALARMKKTSAVTAQTAADSVSSLSSQYDNIIAGIQQDIIEIKGNVSKISQDNDSMREMLLANDEKIEDMQLQMAQFTVSSVDTTINLDKPLMMILLGAGFLSVVVLIIFLIFKSRARAHARKYTDDFDTELDGNEDVLLSDDNSSMDLGNIDVPPPPESDDEKNSAEKNSTEETNTELTASTPDAAADAAKKAQADWDKAQNDTAPGAENKDQAVLDEWSKALNEDDKNKSAEVEVKSDDESVADAWASALGEQAQAEKTGENEKTASGEQEDMAAAWAAALGEQADAESGAKKEESAASNEQEDMAAAWAAALGEQADAESGAKKEESAPSNEQEDMAAAWAAALGEQADAESGAKKEESAPSNEQEDMAAAWAAALGEQADAESGAKKEESAPSNEQEDMAAAWAAALGEQEQKDTAPKSSEKKIADSPKSPDKAQSKAPVEPKNSPNLAQVATEAAALEASMSKAMAQKAAKDHREPKANPDNSIAESAGPEVNPDDLIAESADTEVNPDELIAESAAPEVNPGDLVAESAAPENNPDDPIAESAAPEVNPDDLIAESAAPEVNPDDLIAESAAPEVNPDDLIAESAAPEVNPDDLIAESAAPENNPDDSIAESAAPEVNLDDLVAESAAPENNPDDSIAESAAPEVNPDDLVAESADSEVNPDELIAESADTEVNPDELIAESADTEVNPDDLIAESAAPEVNSDDLVAESADTEVNPDDLIAESAAPEVNPDDLIAESSGPEINPDDLIAENAAPEVNPDDLIAESAAPEVNPDDLVAESAAPEVNPDDLIAENAAPEANPDDLIAESADTEVNPDELIAESAAPEVNPDDLIAESAAPEVNPDDLVAESTDTEVNPDDLIAENVSPEANPADLVAESDALDVNPDDLTADQNEITDNLDDHLPESTTADPKTAGHDEEIVTEPKAIPQSEIEHLAKALNPEDRMSEIPKSVADFDLGDDDFDISNIAGFKSKKLPGHVASLVDNERSDEAEDFAQSLEKAANMAADDSSMDASDLKEALDGAKSEPVAEDTLIQDSEDADENLTESLAESSDTALEKNLVESTDDLVTAEENSPTSVNEIVDDDIDLEELLRPVDTQDEHDTLDKESGDTQEEVSETEGDEPLVQNEDLENLIQSEESSDISQDVEVGDSNIPPFEPETDVEPELDPAPAMQVDTNEVSSSDVPDENGSHELLMADMQEKNAAEPSDAATVETFAYPQEQGTDESALKDETPHDVVTDDGLDNLESRMSNQPENFDAESEQDLMNMLSGEKEDTLDPIIEEPPVGSAFTPDEMAKMINGDVAVLDEESSFEKVHDKIGAINSQEESENNDDSIFGLTPKEHQYYVDELNLARLYFETGDNEEALRIIDDVREHGSPDLIEEIEQILENYNS